MEARRNRKVVLQPYVDVIAFIEDQSIVARAKRHAVTGRRLPADFDLPRF
jgi:hypothetical protein